MVNVSILIFDEVVPSSVTGVIDLLTGANYCLSKEGSAPVFQLQLVLENDGPLPSSLFNGNKTSYKTFATATTPDLIVVPSFNVGDDGVLDRNNAGIQWIKDMREQGAEVASLCIGCYFLAEAGLLNGLEVTSHWAVADEIQKRYPALKMKSDLVITDKDGIYTSGGAFTSLKLILYLIEKFCGRATALWVSKMFAIEMERSTQSHFAIFSGLHQHEDSAILQAQVYIEKNFSDDICIGDVATMVNMGDRNFIRRFKAATNNTPFEYLQRVRIESAKKSIETGEKELSSIIDATGYSDLKTFRSIFKRYTGLSPLEYKKKYARVRV
jgi:transcriptional regulator GlxA family with amidase domain